ncbi:hypothetical protein AVEN_174629-1 [Araneus ventricosus]|uniref:Uncharacterized protein n=1 Tax=Araneus ventricosus TaxID=182803 RepID=A0A4Y2W9S7_ARAVE|nr:hypothetical protein AVEN_193981-1 [Araneus ventricosus]GBO32753.1 hypothetical protein AVEN_36845-1 [Araneus ventricosus]GBO32755.1 hypothetical protein AVEN_121425-1 [Araneus ventricosus]GBO32757.1 hypothetical protein AVEN_174629-1 [Araneus ventricosus]
MHLLFYTFLKIHTDLYHRSSGHIRDSEKGRERFKYYCLEGEPLSLRTLSIKKISGVTSLLGLLALRSAQVSGPRLRNPRKTEENQDNFFAEETRQKPKKKY